MKRRVLVVTVACLLIVLLACSCVAGDLPEQTAPSGQSQQTQPNETTQTPFTIESIRGVELEDVSADSQYYDLACYMLYYDIMNAEEGVFHINRMVTYGDGAAVFTKVNPGIALEEAAGLDTPLRRGQLASMLYQTAEALGYSTQTNETLSQYPDADQVAAEEQAAMCWAVEKGLLRCFLGDSLLPNTAVSRLQLAQALIGLKAMDPEDFIAVQISASLPARQSDSVAQQNHDAIQTVVDTVAQKYGAEGLQVAVIENGVLTDTYAYGWATRDTDPMTPDHKIRVASISKVAVGITAQLLREDGVVDLDGDISQYWDCEVQNPQYPDYPITIRGMLTHTSSIINAGDDTSRAYEDVRRKLQKSGYSSAVPGDIGYWNYNNYAFGVLGMTLELAADRTVDDILREKLYGPMDIDAAFGSGDIKNTDKLATLYRAGGEVARTVEAQKKLHSNQTPGANGSYFAGGLTTSVTDLGKLIALLAGDGRYEGVQLLSPESVAEMESRIETPVPGGSYQAHPMRYWPNLYGRDGIYFHTGSAYGVFNAATYDPVTGDGVVVLTVGASGAKDDYGIYKVCADINAEIYPIIK